MGKYVIELMIRGEYGEYQPGDGVGTVEVKKQTLRSKIIDFPNELQVGDEMRFKAGNEPLTERVDSLYHDISEGYTLLKIKDKSTKDRCGAESEARMEYAALLEKYAFIEKL